MSGLVLQHGSGGDVQYLQMEAIKVVAQQMVVTMQQMMVVQYDSVDGGGDDVVDGSCDVVDDSGDKVVDDEDGGDAIVVYKLFFYVFPTLPIKKT